MELSNKVRLSNRQTTNGTPHSKVAAMSTPLMFSFFINGIIILNIVQQKQDQKIKNIIIFYMLNKLLF